MTTLFLIKAHNNIWAIVLKKKKNQSQILKFRIVIFQLLATADALFAPYSWKTTTSLQFQFSDSKNKNSNLARWNCKFPPLCQTSEGHFKASCFEYPAIT